MLSHGSHIFAPKCTPHLSSGDECDLLHGVVAGCEGTADGVPDLVVSNQGLGLAIDKRLALKTSNNTVNGIINLLVGHSLWMVVEVIELNKGMWRMKFPTRCLR